MRLNESLLVQGGYLQELGSWTIDMSDEHYDEGLRWRLEVLKAQLEGGKVQFAPHLVDKPPSSSRST
jgi:hypothetical protein